MKKLGFLVLFALWGTILQAQTSVKGTVTGENGNAIVGASVALLETYQGAFSGDDGKFEILQVKPGNYSIQVSYLGYEKQIDSITVGSDPLDLNFSLTPNALVTDEIVVSATRAGSGDPIASTDLDKKELERNNVGQDMPYVLRLTPSVVTTSDAGAGIGYTSIRIRGSDATRINVTMNGIPINDAESQGVWWVNMPDLVSSVDGIQVQRGVGSSTNGAGAFGGSIKMQTNQLKDKPYGEVALGGGSFNTQRASVGFGTGLIGKHFTVDGRLSTITSDGYMDRASSDLKSYYLSAAYVGKNTSLRLITFAGKEKTYQAWNGIPGRYLDSARTFNPYDYDNEVDNYGQTHYQALFTQKISDAWSANINLHYTDGGGYFEQYKGDQYNDLLNKGGKEDLADYGMAPVIIGGDTITQTNLIRRRWLDNDFYGTVFSLNYDKGGKLKATLGGGWNQYVGKHYGEVIWSEYSSNSQIRHRYYDNDATKNDFNVYAKANYLVAKFITISADLQYRNVFYEFTGVDDQGNPLRQTDQLNFFNPKAGLMVRLNSVNELYASASMANREPNRDDYTENTASNRPKPEQMIDYELGYNLKMKKLRANLNFYYMDYTDQLVVTGELNDVGSAKKINVPKSYRTGLEMIIGVAPLNWLELNANATISTNKIESFTSYHDDWSTGEQVAVTRNNTDIAFSPNVISGGELLFKLLDDQGVKYRYDLNASLLGKYVGPQYIDNTQNDNRKLDGYFVSDLRLEFRVRKWLFKEVVASFQVNNLLSEEYVSNAWSYSFRSPGFDPSSGDPYVNHEGGDRYNMIGYMPNATRNFLFGLTFKL
ncbi:TonB-dependent receptor [bacterium SCSIO 12741]|nr:TonB-dependent receptor [bacterium SCSIO 12741]